jgi:UDP-2,3-diacylglucosamine hydrolase
LSYDEDRVINTSMNTIDQHTLIIADLHLCNEEPRITQQFIEFMQCLAPKADSIYILGDFFERWSGHDCLDDTSKQVMGALQQFIQRHHKPVYFMQGNRDFLLGKRFCQRTGMQLIKDPTPVCLYGNNYLLTHGDYLCIDDKSHQRLRKVTQNRILQRLFLTLPKKTRQRIMDTGRKKSIARHVSTEAYTGDINRDFTIEECKKNNAQRIIHGHTHKPVINFLDTEKLYQRLTLPSWENSPGYALIDKNGMQIMSLKVHA